MIRPAVLCVLAALHIAAIPAATAQSLRCAPRAQVLDLLAGDGDQTRRAIGLTTGASVMELYASASNGRWSLVVTMPTGLSCLVGTGTGFEVELAATSGAPT
ncbi:hypothetical protein [Rhodobaculum claviforme]|uniref:Uncharacterized protein n=1 Tax=Rhodobaculum claviforme TaxID=1549854 RepID=A0A934WJS0_9RHOB|nr:hypothetical protein [Rhodobaculum claviforme]MBK5928154.1 hypothetical protein [Rhodobaculum claviforme]